MTHNLYTAHVSYHLGQSQQSTILSDHEARTVIEGQAMGFTSKQTAKFLMETRRVAALAVSAQLEEA